MANFNYSLIIRIFLAIFFNVIFLNGIQAQCPTIDIVDLRGVPGYAQFDEMSLCGEADTLALIIYTGDPGTVLGFEFELTLPEGLLYSGWEFTDFNGTSISALDPDPENPTFIVDGFDGDSLIVINIGIQANCEVDLDNMLMLNYSYSHQYLSEANQMFTCENVGMLENELNSAIKIPVLNLLAGLDPAELIITSIGSEFCQSFNISQDGISSYLDSFTFQIQGLDFSSGLQLNSITANGVSVTPMIDPTTNVTSAVISGNMFTGNQLPNPADEQFNTNEIIDFEVCYQVNSCPESADLPLAYSAFYGCNDQTCQTSGQSSFIRIRPTGSLDPIATSSLITAPTVCGADGEIALTIENPNTDTDQNMYTDIRVGYETCEAENLNIASATVGVNIVPAVAFAWEADDLYIDFSVLPVGFDPDGPGGLEDLDGDGVFDDLRGGTMLNISLFLEILCGSGEIDPLSEYCPSSDCPFNQFYVENKTNCGNPVKSYPSGITPFSIKFGGENIRNENTYGIPVTGPLTVGYDFEQFGDLGTVAAPNPTASTVDIVFCYDYNAENFTNCTNNEVFLQVAFGGKEGYLYDLEILSAELSEDGGATYNTTANIPGDVTWDNIDDTRRVMTVDLGSNASNICYRYTMELDSAWCPPPDYMLANQQVIERCNDASCPPTGCDLIRACKSLTLHGDAEHYDCPCVLDGGTREIYRKNYGYTDATCTTPILRENVSALDQVRFLPCDTMVHEVWSVITDAGTLDLDLSEWSFGSHVRGSTVAADASINSDISFDTESLELLELSYQSIGTQYSNRTLIDMSEIPSCAGDALRTDFGITPWGTLGDVAGGNSSNDFLDARLQRFELSRNCDTGDNCVGDFIDHLGYEAGDTINLKYQVVVTKNPVKEAYEILQGPQASNTQNILMHTGFININDPVAGECQVRIESDCGENAVIYGSCVATVSSASKVNLNNCGGSIEHTFYINQLYPADWFLDEFRPVMNIYDVKDPFFTPMAYCGNAKVSNYINGIPQDISLEPFQTENMYCTEVASLSDPICGVSEGSEGTLYWNPYEAGAKALGVGNVDQDSLKITYEFCLLCPEALSASDYSIVYDYGLECSTTDFPYICNGNAGSGAVLCDQQGLIVGNNWAIPLFGENLDSLHNWYNNDGPNVIVNDGRTPQSNVTADLGTGASTLIPSSSPSVSEEIQAIEICNPDPTETAEGVAATVKIPSSIVLTNVYDDAAGTLALVTNLIADDGEFKTYAVTLNTNTMPAGSPCQVIYVGTTLLFCPAPGEVPPSVCVGAISGCAPLDVRAALSDSEGCGSNEICYAYLVGEAGLQTEWFDMPSNPGLCEFFTLKVRVKNVKELELFDLITSFELPTGLTVDMTSWQVAYPGGPTTTGTWTSVPAPDLVVGNTYTYSDDNIWSVPAGTPIHTVGLEGVSAANATEDENKVAFRFTATTNCDEFLSGSKFLTETLAADPCAEGNLSSGIVESPGLVINGADPADNAQILVIADPEELNCQASMNTFGITALNTSDYPTADSVITCITIPDGLTYQSGSIQVVQPTGYTITGLTETIVGNDLHVCFISPKIGVSQAMKITFDAMVDEGMECGDVRMDVDIKSVIKDQICASGGMCDVFVQNSINPGITVKIRPPFMAEDWNVYTECADPDDVSLYYEFTIDHNGPDAVNQIYTTNFYQDMDGDGFINSNIDNLVSTTTGSFSVNDGSMVTVSGNSIIPNGEACPLMMELVYETACNCDREELRLDNIGLKSLAPFTEPVSMCPGDCLEIEICGFVDVVADSVCGATGVVYEADLDYSRANTYTIPHDSTTNPITTGPVIDFVNYASLTDNQAADASGVGGLLFPEQSPSADPSGEAYLIANFPKPVNVERFYMAGGKVSGWPFVNGLQVYSGRKTQLEYSLDGGITWIDSGLDENFPNNNTDVFEYILPTPIVAQDWRLTSRGILNWGTSEFRFEGAPIPYETAPPVTRSGNMVTICVPENHGIDTPMRVEFNTGVGSCENIEVLEIINIGDVDITLGPQIVACGTDCVDLEIEILGDVGTLNNATVSWSPQLGIMNPNSLETEACVSNDQTYIATVTFPGGCVKTASVFVDHQLNPPLEVDGAEVECFNTKDYPILIAPAGFDVYMWFQVINGIEIPLGSTVVNTYAITEAGGEYFVKGIATGVDCPGKSPSYQITDKLLPQVCLPVKVTKSNP